MPRTARLVGLGVFLAPLAIYFLSLSPNITFGDAGDFAVAAHTWSIAHPPGYPLYVILGKIAMTLIPMGTPAFRFAMISSVFGALACLFIYLTGLILTKRVLPSAIGALAVGVTGWLWSQSSIIEVYSLNALFFTLIQYLFFRWISERKDKHLYLLGAISGASLANHLSIIFISIIPLIFFLLIDAAKRKSSTKQGSTFLLCFLVGLSIYAYIPISSLYSHLHSWGDLADLNKFWDHVTMRTYQGNFSFTPPIQVWRGSLLQALRTESIEFTVFLPILLFGLLRIPKMFRPYYFTSTVLALWFFVLASREIPILNYYSIPFTIQLGIATSIGIASLSELFNSKKSFQYLVGFFAVAATLANLFIHYTTGVNNKSVYPHNFAIDILSRLPDDAIFIACSDITYFPIRYVQYVEDYRKDVVVVSWNYLTSSLELDFLREKNVGGVPTNREALSQTETIKSIINKNPDRSVFISEYQEFDNRLGLVFVDPIFRVIADSQNQAANIHLAPKLSERVSTGNKDIRSAQNLGLNNAVRKLYADGNFKDAEALAGQGLNFDLKNSTLWRIRSAIASKEQRSDDAFRFATEALKADPYNSLNNRRMALVYSDEGDPVNTIKYLNLAIRYAEPSSIKEITENLWGLSQVYYATGDYVNAKRFALKILDYTSDKRARDSVSRMLNALRERGY